MSMQVFNKMCNNTMYLFKMYRYRTPEIYGACIHLNPAGVTDDQDVARKMAEIEAIMKFEMLSADLNCPVSHPCPLMMCVLKYIYMYIFRPFRGHLYSVCVYLATCDHTVCIKLCEL